MKVGVLQNRSRREDLSNTPIEEYLNKFGSGLLFLQYTDVSDPFDNSLIERIKKYTDENKNVAAIGACGNLEMGPDTRFYTIKSGIVRYGKPNKNEEVCVGFDDVDVLALLRAENGEEQQLCESSNIYPADVLFLSTGNHIRHNKELKNIRDFYERELNTSALIIQPGERSPPEAITMQDKCIEGVVINMLEATPVIDQPFYLYEIQTSKTPYPDHVRI